MWDARSGQSLAQLRGHRGRINSAHVSADGARIITASTDGTARVWDTSGNNLAVLPGHAAGIRGALLNPAGTRAITQGGDFNHARLWDARTAAPIMEFDNSVSAAFSPHGSRIITEQRNGGGLLRDGTTGRLIADVGGDRADSTKTTGASLSSGAMAADDC